MTTKTLHLWESALMMALAVTLLIGCCASAAQSALADRVLRLHVVANSDDAEDQALKLSVRDAILAETGPLLDGAANSAGAEKLLAPRLEELEQAAERVLSAAGCEDGVTVTITDQWFPTRQYDTFALPAGSYRALKVVIGAGEGQNWWCVVFPPLCFGSVIEQAEETAVLSEEQTALISGQDGEYVLKFRIIEWWEELVHRFRSR